MAADSALAIARLMQAMPRTTFPDPDEATMAADPYDLIVIGSRARHGSSAALGASFFGKRVALVERAKEVGGAGINWPAPSRARRCARAR